MKCLFDSTGSSLSFQDSEKYLDILKLYELNKAYDQMYTDRVVVYLAVHW